MTLKLVQKSSFLLYNFVYNKIDELPDYFTIGSILGIGFRFYVCSRPTLNFANPVLAQKKTLTVWSGRRDNSYDSGIWG